MTEERPAPGESTPSPGPATERTPSWPRRAVKVAAGAAWDDLSSTGRRLVDTGRLRARTAWDRRPPRSRIVAWVFLTAASAAGLLAVAAQNAVAGALPSSLDWDAAAALLERDARPGDAAIVAPAWAERARAVLPAAVPVFALPSYREEPLLGVRRAWLVALPGAPLGSDRIAREIAARAASDGGPQRLGGLTVTRYDLAQPTRAIAFLPDWLDQATARRGGVPCERDRAALRCPGDPPLRIAREVREVGGAPRPCVSARPGSGEGGPLALTFPAVPMGMALRGGAGIVGRIPAPKSVPVRLSVQVDGEEFAALELSPDSPGWSRLEARTASLAAEPHAVTVVIASHGAAPPTVCFDLWTLP